MPRVYPADKIVTFHSITGNLDKDNKVTLTGSSILTEKFTVILEKVTTQPTGDFHEGRYYLVGHQCFYLIDVAIGKTYFKNIPKKELEKEKKKENVKENKYWSDDEDERIIPVDLSQAYYREHGIPSYVLASIVGSIVTKV
jgi:hypothetical protein